MLKKIHECYNSGFVLKIDIHYIATLRIWFKNYNVIIHFSVLRVFLHCCHSNSCVADDQLYRNWNIFCQKGCNLLQCDLYHCNENICYFLCNVLQNDHSNHTYNICNIDEQCGQASYSSGRRALQLYNLSPNDQIHCNYNIWTYKDIPVWNDCIPCSRSSLA